MSLQGQVKTKIIGLDHLQKLPLELKIKVLYSAMWQGAKPVEKAAQAYAPSPQTGAPYAKGRIPRSIRRMRARLKHGADNPTVMVGVLKRRGQLAPKYPKDDLDAFPWYWWYVHFGTQNQAAQPFLLNGFLDAKGDSVRVINGAVKKGIQGLKRKYDVSKLGINL